jgi:hypothetical protein
MASRIHASSLSRLSRLCTAAAFEVREGSAIGDPDPTGQPLE